MNVVFVLRVRVVESVVNCYQELAQQLALAIAHEEKRCQYLTKEAKVSILKNILNFTIYFIYLKVTKKHISVFK